MLNSLRNSPVVARVAPFAVFALFTIVQIRLGEAGQYLVYTLKTLAGAGMLWLVWRQVREMRWNFSWEAVAAGIAVWAIWVGLEGRYPLILQRAGTFNPPRTLGSDSTLAWMFVGIRLAGSSLVVPLVEEVFYRSFLYRLAIRSDFLGVPLNRFDWKAFLFVGTIFGLQHFEWLPGILCAFVYQALVIKKNRLGDAVTAHGITNLMLGVWVVWRDAWYFW
jgi:CAAX prenyl protease-like protein